jgi:hypothetical protein
MMQNTGSPPQCSEQHLTEISSSGSSARTGGDTPRPKTGRELRSSPRKKFQYYQQIAPIHDNTPPSTDDFIKVECNDISQGGISFFLRRPPGCKHFAIMLGGKNATTMLTAQVVRLQEIEHNDQHMYLVGCKFVNRLETE